MMGRLAMKATILIVEDEAQIRKLLREHIESEGFTVLEAGDGHDALKKWEEYRPDLVLLDIMLPQISGLEVMKTIRKQANTPVILLTARTDEVDKLLGLELGADDYITKPFSSREVVARIQAVLRRVSGREEPVYSKGGLKLNHMHLEAEVEGHKLELTTTEFKILSLLAEHPGRVYTRLQILERLYGDVYEGYERTIDTHINRIRRKLAAVPGSSVSIGTVYGVGYRMVIKEEQNE